MPKSHSDVEGGSKKATHRRQRANTIWRNMAVLAVCIAGGLLFGTASTHAHERPSTIGLNLPQLVREKQHEIRASEEQNHALEDRVDSMVASLQGTGEVGAENGTEPQEPPLDALITSWVTGPGVIVELSDAPPSISADPQHNVSNNDLVVHQQDLDAVMNALWRGGAEAMAVQGIRITPQVPVRCIGNVILIGGQTFAPPYRIEAIGNDQAMLASLHADPQMVIYKQYVDAYGLGLRTESKSSLRLPPITEKLSVKHAQPLEENDK